MSLAAKRSIEHPGLKSHSNVDSAVHGSFWPVDIRKGNKRLLYCGEEGLKQSYGD